MQETNKSQILMTLIALYSFRNPRNRIPGQPIHIERGTRFEVGSFATLKELERNDEKNAQLVVSLMFAKCCAEPTPEVVKRIEDAIAQDEQRAKHFAALDAQAALVGTGERFQRLLAQLSRQQAEARPAVRK